MSFDDWLTTDPRDREPDGPSMPYRCCDPGCAGLSFDGSCAVMHHRATGHAIRGRDWPRAWPNAHFGCCADGQHAAKASA